MILASRRTTTAPRPAAVQACDVTTRARPRLIVAGSGGFLPTPRLWGVLRPGGIVRYALERTGVERPRVCLVMTASGDNAAYLSATYAALSRSSCDVDHLAVFPQPNRPVDEAFGRADLIWVGGGSVANLLALWSLHGIDAAMRDAWDRGVVLAGVSAGAICWHVGGPTDSFGPDLQAVTNGLGLLPYAAGVHYDTEEQRRPLLHELVASGILPDAYATDDGVAIAYEGVDPVEVVLDDDAATAGAYLVRRAEPGRASERRLSAGRIA